MLLTAPTMQTCSGLSWCKGGDARFWLLSSQDTTGYKRQVERGSFVAVAARFRSFATRGACSAFDAYCATEKTGPHMEQSMVYNLDVTLSVMRCCEKAFLYRFYMTNMIPLCEDSADNEKKQEMKISALIT